MPTTTPLMMVNRSKQYGAEVILHGGVFDDAADYAMQLAQEQGLTYIPVSYTHLPAWRATAAVASVQLSATTKISSLSAG